MKKAQRWPYLALNFIPIPPNAPGTPSLCAWCKWAEWSGSCEVANLSCKHPLEIIADDAGEVWCGRDCWAFRPDVPLAVADGAVANWLQGNEAIWTRPTVVKEMPR